MDGNQINDIGLDYILSFYKKNNNLKNVNLSKNPVGFNNNHIFQKLDHIKKLGIKLKLS